MVTGPSGALSQPAGALGRTRKPPPRISPREHTNGNGRRSQRPLPARTGSPEDAAGHGRAYRDITGCTRNTARGCENKHCRRQAKARPRREKIGSLAATRYRRSYARTSQVYSFPSRDDLPLRTTSPRALPLYATRSRQQQGLFLRSKVWRAIWQNRRPPVCLHGHS